MSGGYLLSVDSGTTATKVALFNDKGELQAISTHEYKLITPSALAVEIDADTLWNAFKAGVAEVVKKTKTNTKDIAAIGISAQGETLILLRQEREASQASHLMDGQQSPRRSREA